MAKNPQDVINEPIRPEDYRSEEEELTNIEEPGADEVDISDEEIDPIGDAALDELGGSELTDIEFDAELAEPEFPGVKEAEFIPPEQQVRWTAVPQENGDIWSEHVDGFVLRARPLSAQQGDKIKYIAQLFKNNKMIEKGVIWVDQNTDAREYLQNVSDRILDRMGLVNVSMQAAEPEAAEPEAEEEFAIGGTEGEAEEELELEL